MLFRITVLLFCLFSPGVSSAAELKVAMGSTLPPMHFKDTAGHLAGFEVDLVNLFTQEQGLRAVFLDPAQQGRSSLDLVRSGKADMAVNCITITDERKELVDFSDPYFSSGTAFLAKKDSGSRFDLYRRSYVTVRNSLYARTLAEKNLPVWKEVGSLEEAIRLLKEEKLPLYRPITVVYDWTALGQAAEENKGLVVADFLIAEEKYGAAFQRGADRNVWNAFLQRIRQDGSYDQLLQKWFGSRRVPSLMAVRPADAGAASSSSPNR